MAFDAPPPPPVAAEIRTVEELGIGEDRATTVGERIVEVASIVLRRYRSGNRKPSYRNVRFENASRTSRYQQLVRELVEATMYGQERKWREASCCARSTQIKLHRAAEEGRYIEIKDLGDIIPGDIVYIGGGSSSCSDCGRKCGHVMIYMGDEDGKKMMWQNTSFEGKALCNIPLRDEQAARFLAAYRFPSEEVKEEKPPPLPTLDVSSVLVGETLVKDLLSLNSPMKPKLPLEDPMKFLVKLDELGV